MADRTGGDLRQGSAMAAPLGTVLVTGATGCIGQHALPRLLSAGWNVHAVSSKAEPRGFKPGEITWHRANLLDSSEASRVVETAAATHLLHLAWYIAPGKWAQAQDNFTWVRASLD